MLVGVVGVFLWLLCWCDDVFQEEIQFWCVDDFFDGFVNMYVVIVMQVDVVVELGICDMCVVFGCEVECYVGVVDYVCDFGCCGVLVQQ